MKLQGKVALVTGAGRGIGKAIAQTFATNGASVIINYLHSEQAATTLAEVIRDTCHVQATAIKADVSDPSQVQAMVNQVINEYGRIDILVNNAGTTLRGSLKTISEESWDRVIDTNLKGSFLCSQVVSEVMLQTGGGCMINIASIRGITGASESVHYAVSKAGVIALTKSLAMELAPTIRVNCIAPGYTLTDLHAGKSSEQIKQIESTIPLRKFGKVDDIAATALFLASDDANNITGATIVVSGGLVML